MGILLKLLAEVQPVPDDSEWAEEESEVTARLREGVLTALATMTLGLEKIREVLTNSPLFIPYVMAAMSDAHVGVRLAACQCVRSLSRSVQVLRTSIVDSGLGLKLFEMMRKEQDKRVQSVALMGISNLVLDFSPLREKLVEMGALSKIIALLDDPDELLQINAIWAIKNAIYKASFEEKRNIFNQLKWETFRR
ncbi:hypothetical protein FRC02_001655 [Tulasnella sp. 418]|nr:hypothetical protein FRC02_001655 [Tulasnella sp. 418]